MDKAHCFMNVDDEHEFEHYYDFSKTYEGHPEAIKLITKKSTNTEQSDKSAAKEDGEGWEDVDVESDDEDIEDASDEEDEKKEDDQSDSGAFSVITESKEGSNSVPF